MTQGAVLKRDDSAFTTANNNDSRSNNYSLLNKFAQSVENEKR
jgi:hypothetical protein